MKNIDCTIMITIITNKANTELLKKAYSFIILLETNVPFSNLKFIKYTPEGISPKFILGYFSKKSKFLVISCLPERSIIETV